MIFFSKCTDLVPYLKHFENKKLEVQNFITKYIFPTHYNIKKTLMCAHTHRILLFTQFIVCILWQITRVVIRTTFIVVNDITSVYRTVDFLVNWWFTNWLVFVTKMSLIFVCCIWNVNWKPSHSIDKWTWIWNELL